MSAIRAVLLVLCAVSSGVAIGMAIKHTPSPELTGEYFVWGIQAADDCGPHPETWHMHHQATMWHRRVAP